MNRNFTDFQHTQHTKKRARTPDSPQGTSSKRHVALDRLGAIENPLLNLAPLNIADTALEFLKEIETIGSEILTKALSWESLMQAYKGKISSTENLTQGSIALPILSIASTAEEKPYHDSQIALLCTLFSNTAKLYAMVMFPRSEYQIEQKHRQPIKQDNYHLDQFYNAYLDILNSYVSYLKTLKSYIEQSQNTDFTKESNIQKFYQKIDAMSELCRGIWAQVASQQHKKSYWINDLPNLPKLSDIIKADTYDEIIDTVQTAYEAIEESLAKKICELYCLGQAITWERKIEIKNISKAKYQHRDPIISAQEDKKEPNQQKKYLNGFIESLKELQKEYPNDFNTIEKALLQKYAQTSQASIDNLTQKLNSLACNDTELETILSKIKETLNAKESQLESIPSQKTNQRTALVKKITTLREQKDDFEQNMKTGKQVKQFRTKYQRYTAQLDEKIKKLDKYQSDFENDAVQILANLKADYEQQIKDVSAKYTKDIGLTGNPGKHTQLKNEHDTQINQLEATITTIDAHQEQYADPIQALNVLKESYLSEKKHLESVLNSINYKAQEIQRESLNQGIKKKHIVEQERLDNLKKNIATFKTYTESYPNDFLQAIETMREPEEPVKGLEGKTSAVKTDFTALITKLTMLYPKMKKCLEDIEEQFKKINTEPQKDPLVRQINSIIKDVNTVLTADPNSGKIHLPNTIVELPELFSTKPTFMMQYTTNPHDKQASHTTNNSPSFFSMAPQTTGYDSDDSAMSIKFTL